MIEAMPPLGLGTWKLAKKECYATIRGAVACGYRHFDCAAIYKNETEIGRALSAATAAKEVKREELWLTSKLWNNAHAPRHVRPAVERSLRDLQTEYLDLFLIHWPVSFRPDIEHPKRAEHYLEPSEERLLETWYALEKLVKKGLIRFIGVCNYKPERLRRLTATASISPAVVQVECHPWLPQNELSAYCRRHGITLTAYSPLGSGDRPANIRRAGEDLLLFPPLLTLAEECRCTPAQLLLAWGLAHDRTVIPKAASPSHYRENLAAMSITLPREVLAALDNCAGDDCNIHRRLITGKPFCGRNSPYTLQWLWGK